MLLFCLKFWKLRVPLLGPGQSEFLGESINNSLCSKRRMCSWPPFFLFLVPQGHRLLLGEPDASVISNVVPQCAWIYDCVVNTDKQGAGNPSSA